MHLSGELLKVHTQDVRCLCSSSKENILFSGSRDGNVIVWAVDPLARFCLSPSWPLCLAIVPTEEDGGAERRNVDDFIAVGCDDGSIRILAWKSQAVAILPFAMWQAHESPVCSLHCLNRFLLSGGWDETAHIFEFSPKDRKLVESRADRSTLGGHENNVVALWLTSSAVVTGSSGIAVGGKVVGHQLRLWHKDAKGNWHVKRSMEQHAAGIRSLCDVRASGRNDLSSPAFASGSNDGSVRFWTETGDLLYVAQVSGQGYILSLLLLKSNAEDLCVAAGDDAGKVSLITLKKSSASTSSCVHCTSTTVGRPTDTIWCIARPPGRVGIAAGMSTGHIRLLTEDPAHALSDSATSNLLSSDNPPGAEKWQQQQKVGNDIPVCHLSEQANCKGECNGALSLFWLNGVAAVYEWCDKLGWVLRGPISQPRKRQELDGEYYDSVIDVEVDSASKGYLQLKIGFNQGDRANDVATNFCARHNLGPEYIEQIKSFASLHGLV
jgi:hypothetical protein